MESYSEYKQVKVREILELTKNNELDTRAEQRIFKHNYQNLCGIVKSVMKKRMYTPAIICDIRSSLEFAKKNNNVKDIKYFSDLIERRGLLYSIEDSQHRFKYYHTAKYHMPKDIYEKLLDCTVPVYYLYNHSTDDLTDVFNDANSGNKIKTHEKIWSIINNFNDDLKTITRDLGLVNFNKTVDVLSRFRSSYKFVLKGIKMCAYKEKMHNINSQTGDTALKTFVDKEYDINTFKSIVMCLHTMMWILNKYDIANNTKDFTKFNLLFTIHVIKYNNYDFDEEWIVRFINGIGMIGNMDNSRAQLPQRYDFIKKQLNYQLQPQINFN